jgi:hypothetical protein
MVISILLLVAFVSSQEFDHDWNSLDAGLTREEIGRKTANIEPQSSDSSQQIGFYPEESPPRSSS